MPTARSRRWLTVPLIGLMLTPNGCKSPNAHRQQADEAAYGIVEEAQTAALGRTEPFTIQTAEDTLRRRLLESQDLPVLSPASFGISALEPIEHWPNDDYLELGVGLSDGLIAANGRDPIILSLDDVLRIAAANSRDYQSAKETVFQAALSLELERDAFRSTFASAWQSRFELRGDSGDGTSQAGVANSASLGFDQQFKNGIDFSTAIALDLAQIIGSGAQSSRGINFDASISIPLLRGAGRHIAAEPLQQAERNTLYAIWRFERFKRTFAVQIGSQYLSVLQQLDTVWNASNNYRSLIRETQRAEDLAREGRLSPIQVDQARQDELRARASWISAQQSYLRQLDSFKVQLGLPADAFVLLRTEDLRELAASTEALIPEIETMTEASELPDRPNLQAVLDALQRRLNADATRRGTQQILETTLAQRERGMVRLDDVIIARQQAGFAVRELERATEQARAQWMNYRVRVRQAKSGTLQTGRQMTNHLDQPREDHAQRAQAILLETPSRELAGPLELIDRQAILLAFANRLDLRIAEGSVFDAQRDVVLAADRLRAELTLLGTASAGGSRSVGSSGLDDAGVRFDQGNYDALLTLNLPFERTAEQVAYRSSLISLESEVRSFQDLEDQVKLDVQNLLRELEVNRDSLRTQALSVRLAETRVESTRLFLERGDADIRDVLEAQEDLVGAQNALTNALVNYRIAELEFQRDTGILEVDHTGQWSALDEERLQQMLQQAESQNTEASNRPTAEGEAT